MKLSKTSLISFIISSICFFVLTYVYISYLSVRWGYFGFTYNPPLTYEVLIVYLLVVSPTLWLSVTIDRYSSFVSWMLYYFFYVPTLIILLYRDSDPDDRSALILSISLSFFVLSKFPKFKFQVKYLKLNHTMFWLFFFIVYVFLLGYLLLIFGKNFNLSSLSTIYVQRSAGSEVIIGSYAGYVIGIMSGSMNPFLMGVGLINKNKLLFLVGALGQLLLFGTLASKGVFISILTIPFFYYLLFHRKNNKTTRIGLLILISLILPMFLGLVLEGRMLNSIQGIIWMRTYGIVGLLTGAYGDFFFHNPYTYFSHVNIVSTFVHYPYEQSLGFLVSENMGLAGMNANANFFATDGIAAGGAFGVVIIGAFVGFVLQVFNNIIGKEYLSLASIASVPAIMYLANSSFFTTLLTGGLLLLIMLLYLWRCIEKK